MDDTLPSPSRWRLARWVNLLAGATFALSFVAFVQSTAPVRLANVDDALYQQLTSDRTIEKTLDMFATNQARFYYSLLPWRAALKVYGIINPLAFSAVRACFFFLGAGLTGWVVGAITKNCNLGCAIALVIVATLHLPAVYFPVLSYPTIAVAWCAIVASLLCTVIAAHSSRIGFMLGAAALLALAALLTEAALIYFPLHVVAAWAAGRRSLRALTHLLWPLGAVLLIYVASYAAYARVHPSTYPGTQLSLQPREIANVLVRQTVGVIPGLELVLHRSKVQTDGPRWRSAGEIIDILSAVPMWAVGLAALQLLTVLALGFQALDGPRIGKGLIATAAACVLMPNLVPSLTRGQQIMAYQRQYPYAYSYFAFCAGVVLCLACWHYIATRHDGRRRGAALVVLGLVTGLAALSAGATNHHTLELLRRWYN